MHSALASLPDLAQQKRRNTALSLSEGFVGGLRSAVLASSQMNLAKQPGFTGNEGGSSRIGEVLPLYYRQRCMRTELVRGNLRQPARMDTELKQLEGQMATEMRPLHPFFFQRFNDMQLCRLIGAMDFLKMSQGRWVFGSEALVPEPWPGLATGDRAFILLYGRIALYTDGSGTEGKTELSRGAIFGEAAFRICDESMQDCLGFSAMCLEPCTVGCLSTHVIQTAFADRVFGNKRIASLVRGVPSLRPALDTKSDVEKENRDPSKDMRSGSKDNRERPASGGSIRAGGSQDNGGRPHSGDGSKSRSADSDVIKKAAHKDSGAIAFALNDMSKIATVLVVRPGEEVLTSEGSDEQFLIVAKGVIEVRSRVTLTQKLDALPPRKTRLRVTIHKGQDLDGDSWFDTLDPYVIVKLGDKKFQTPAQIDAGANPDINYPGVFMYDDEEELEFAVMDRERFKPDGTVGQAFFTLSEMPSGKWSGALQLTARKMVKGAWVDEPTGKLHVTISFDFEKVTALTKKAKERKWDDQVLFTLPDSCSWGQEPVMLGHLFHKILDASTKNFAYRLTLGDPADPHKKFRIFAASRRGASENAIVWKVTKSRFQEFIKRGGREKQFLQACRVSALEKQTTLKQVLGGLIETWEREEQMLFLRSADFLNPGHKGHEGMDVDKFKSVFRGVKAHITIRSALNLTGGGWFEGTDFYTRIKFRGRGREFRTSVLEDGGADPVWNSEGVLVYDSENVLDLSIWEYDPKGHDEQIAIGTLTVEHFVNGFEGMVPMAPPPGKKKRSAKPMMLTMGILWDLPKSMKPESRPNSAARIA